MHPVKRNIVTAAAIVVALASTAAFYLWETKYSYSLLDKKDKESALIKEVKADTFSDKEIKDMMHSKLKDPDSVLLKLSHVYKLKYDDKEMKDVETFSFVENSTQKEGLDTQATLLWRSSTQKRLEHLCSFTESLISVSKLKKLLNKE